MKNKAIMQEIVDDLIKVRYLLRRDRIAPSVIAGVDRAQEIIERVDSLMRELDTLGYDDEDEPVSGTETVDVVVAFYEFIKGARCNHEYTESPDSPYGNDTCRFCGHKRPA